MKSTNLRVPDALWESVKRQAADEHTSANAVVIKALEQFVGGTKGDGRTRVQRLSALVGIVNGGPSDLADRHDDYLQQPD